MPRCRRGNSSRPVVYQQGKECLLASIPAGTGCVSIRPEFLAALGITTRGYALEFARRHEKTMRGGLSADQKNPNEDGGDSGPLPSGDVFAEKNRGEADGDRSIERAENADDGDLFEPHAEIAEGKGGGVEEAHAVDLASRLAIFEAERESGGEDHGKGYGGTRDTDQPNRGQGASSWDDADA